MLKTEFDLIFELHALCFKETKQLLRQYFIWHRLLQVFLTRSSEFSLPESIIAFELIGSVIIRCAPQKMITGHQVSSLDVCWNLIDAEKASMNH